MKCGIVAFFHLYRTAPQSEGLWLDKGQHAVASSLGAPAFTPRFWRRSSEPAKQGREMTLAFESGPCSNLDKRQVALAQQMFSALDAPLG